MGSLSSVLARIPGLGGYEAQNQINREKEQGQLSNMAGLAGLMQQAQKRKMMEQEMAAREEFAKDPSKAMQYLSATNPGSLAELLTKQKMESDLFESERSRIGGMSAGAPVSTTRVANPQAEMAGITDPAQRASLQNAMRADQNNVPTAGTIGGLTQEQALEMAGSRSAAIAKKGTIIANEFSKREAAQLALEGRNDARTDQQSFLREMAANRPAAQPRNLQLTTDETGAQLIVHPDGTTSPLTAPNGSGVRKPVGADKPMTEFQGKAALYGTRSAQSDKVLKSLEDKISTTGLTAAQSLGVAGNFVMSSEQKRVSQAQRDFVNAVLRQESGAVISEAEFENAKKQYFPAPGDDKKTVEQKRANRQIAIQGFSRMSGPKGAADIQTVLDNPLLPGVSARPETPQQSSGKIGGGYVEIRKTHDGRTLGKTANGTIEEIK